MSISEGTHLFDNGAVGAEHDHRRDLPGIQVAHQVQHGNFSATLCGGMVEK
ncbi:MAG TPA: hypothetical protein VN976_22985 [Verrucomicrobiae bacterium]|nr:hypothetical protein [Verrucomicrobiae bacterium]